MIRSITHGLGARLSLALALVLFVFSITAAAIFVKSNQRYENKVSQTIHQNLAQHIVDEYLLFKDGKPDRVAAKQSFEDLMILGPNFEFYLLDKTGKIVSYSSKKTPLIKTHIDLSPIKSFINTEDISTPILSTDPKTNEKNKIFSAAPIFQMGEVYGYLYIVIGSEVRSAIEASLFEEHILDSSLALLIAVLMITACIVFIVVTLITHPLKTLTLQVKLVGEKGFENLEKGISKKSGLDKWSALSENDIHIVGTSFRQAINKLEHQYQHIVSIDELRKELLSHLSHDLRTPLATLLGYLETWEIQYQDLSENQSREYIATARKSAQKIVVLVDQLFDLANLDSNNVTVTKEQISVAELVQDVMQKFSLIAAEKHVELCLQPKDSAIQVYADIEKLERVFVNLIENALRHTPKGGKITINLQANSSLVFIEVSDTGIGIPEDDIPFIFDPHFKAGNSVRENTAHGGLGLAITKRLLELHQAEINVRSALHKGTTFSFTLASTG